jgi:hypothetical protein
MHCTIRLCYRWKFSNVFATSHGIDYDTFTTVSLSWDFFSCGGGRVMNQPISTLHVLSTHVVHAMTTCVFSLVVHLSRLVNYTTLRLFSIIPHSASRFICLSTLFT